MWIGIDDSEVIRAERRLREDRVVLADAVRQFRERCRSSLTRPSTLVLLLVAGGIAGARSKPGAATARRFSSHFGAILRFLWVPLFKSAAALAIQRVLQRQHDGAAPASPRYEDVP